MEIKEVIIEKHLTINCPELAVMGLPLSGKTELLHQMLELKVDGTKQSSSLGFYLAVLCHEQYDDSHTWIKSTGKECTVYSPFLQYWQKPLCAYACIRPLHYLAACLWGAICIKINIIT